MRLEMWMGRGKQGGHGAASAEMHVGSITYIICHGHIIGGGLLVIIISMPWSVYGGEMTVMLGDWAGPPDWTGRNKLFFFAPCLSWGGLSGLCGRPRISDVPSLLGPHM